MSSSLQNTLLFLRVTLGGLFFYDGLMKVLSDTWTAAPQLLNAVHAPHFFAWFAQSGNIGWVNGLNAWGLLLIGIALILGIRMKFAGVAGIILMALYYILNLNFPMASDVGYIIDRHIIYIGVLWALIAGSADQFWGLDRKIVVRVRN